MNIRLGILFLVGIHNMLWSQNPHFIPSYSFLNLDSNTLQLPENKATFIRLFDKLDQCIFEGKGNPSFMHFGGSHIQADIMTTKLRESFHHFSPGIHGGRGFIFPYRLAHTNNPYYFNVKSKSRWKGYRAPVSSHHATWGLSAITAVTKDSNAQLNLSFPHKERLGYTFSRVKVLHSMDSNSYEVCYNGQNKVQKKVDAVMGYTTFDFGLTTDTFALRLKKTDSLQNKFELYGFILEDENPGIVYHSIGVNGASTSSYLRGDKTLFLNHLKQMKPDVVIFSIGINDTYSRGYKALDYFNNYDTIITRIRSVFPQCAIIFMTNSDSYFKKRYPNKKVYSSIVVMRQLAKKHDAAIWNLFEVMGGLKSIDTWYKNGLAARDRVHFNSKGYRLLGSLFFSAFAKAYSEHIKKRYNAQY